MEGISNEAGSMAGHWGLGKLIALYDDNRISIDGHTEISFTEDVAARFVALGWHVQHVKDGNTDLGAIRNAIEEAKKVTDKPSFIKVRPAPGMAARVYLLFAVTHIGSAVKWTDNIVVQNCQHSDSPCMRQHNELCECVNALSALSIQHVVLHDSVAGTATQSATLPTVGLRKCSAELSGEL